MCWEPFCPPRNNPPGVGKTQGEKFLGDSSRVAAAALYTTKHAAFRDDFGAAASWQWTTQLCTQDKSHITDSGHGKENIQVQRRWRPIFGSTKSKTLSSFNFFNRSLNLLSQVGCHKSHPIWLIWYKKKNQSSLKSAVKTLALSLGGKLVEIDLVRIGGFTT